WQYGTAHDLAPLVALELALGRPWGWHEETVRHLLLTQLPSYAGHFALGIVAGSTWLRWQSQPPTRAIAWTLRATAIAGIALVYWIYADAGTVFGEFTWVVTPIAFGLALLAAATSRSPVVSRVLGRGPLAFAGRVSYSAYLYHLPLLMLWNLHA